MKPEIPIFVSLFVCLAYAIKTIVEARMRSRLIAAQRPDELIQAILMSDERRRHHSSLRWGTVLTCLAAGFGVIALLGWQDVTAGTVAIVLGATGLGNLIAGFLIGRVTPDP